MSALTKLHHIPTEYLGFGSAAQAKVSGSQLPENQKDCAARMVHPALALPTLQGPQDRSLYSAGSTSGQHSWPYSPHHCQPCNNSKAFASLKMHKKDSQNERNSFCIALGVQRELYKTDIINEI